MTNTDSRRVYYDHEPAYRKIHARGGRGWDDLHPDQQGDSYEAFRSFLDSKFCPQPGPGVRALDLGCGGGQAAMMLAERGYAVYGLDYSETAVEIAMRNAREAGVTIQFSVGDCLALDSFGSGSETTDLILDNHVLHCVIGAQDRSSFLRSAYRVLKPRGILFSETMSCEGDFDAAAMDADPATRTARKHTRYWVSQAELNEEINTAGFRILYQELKSQKNAPEGAHIITYAERPVPGSSS